MYVGIEEVHLIHHSHTDVGYTHDQPVVWELHQRFLERAIALCKEWEGSQEPHALRWTVENTGVLLRWLEGASDQEVGELLRLVEAGNIEVTAMPYNITPLYDTDELCQGLQPVARLREMGIPIRYAMQSDVNGHNWPLVDVLLEAGIEGFSMATNIHFGGSPLRWPNAFWWQGPSGRSILAWNGWDYGFARDAGIDRDLQEFRDIWWPRIESWLRSQDYPLPVLMLQIYDAFGDNAPPSPTLPEFVRRWNQEVGTPRLRISLPSHWWRAVKEHADLLPTHRGDWTDFWNFGCGSSARETAINRASRGRLRAADALVAALGTPTRRWSGLRDEAWEALMLWDEHTWGADISVHQPQAEDTLCQWQHKASYAHTARSLSLLLARDASAELGRRVRGQQGDILLCNSLPFPTRVVGPLRGAHLLPRGRADDPTAARHWASRDLGMRWALAEAVEVPACGYKVVSRELLASPLGEGEELVVQTRRHRVEFDPQRGGIRSWHTALNGELVDPDSPYTLGGWVHETPVEEPGLEHPRRALWAPVERRLGLARGWRGRWQARRSGPTRLLRHMVYRWSWGVEVLQELELPVGGQLMERTIIPHDEDWLEVEASWDMGQHTYPEATYLAFPLALRSPRARVDVGGQAMRVEEDQLPRACRDYYTVQGWVDLEGIDGGVTIACPDAPMVQLGGFTFGWDQQRVELEAPLVLGWVTNNYWETNFRAHQPGRVSARYRLLPYRGEFQEARAHRLGLEMALPPLVQPLWEPTGGELPGEGSWLQLPELPVITLHIWREGERVLLRLQNAADEESLAMVGSGLLRVAAAHRCDLWGGELEELPVRDGGVALAMPPRALATLSLTLARD